MKQINILIALLIGLLVGLASCSNEDSLLTGADGKGEAELAAVTLNFGSAPSTRMAGGVAGDEDAYVDNVWVLQYDVTDEVETICMAQYVETFDDNANRVANIFLESDDTKTYKVFCLANTGDVLLFSDPSYTGFATISQLRSMVRQLSAKTAGNTMWRSEREGGAVRQSLLMNGVARDQETPAPSESGAEFTVSISPGVAKDLKVQLFHLSARIALNLYHQYKVVGSEDDFFTLLSVQLKQVPSKLSFFGEAALTPVDYIDYKAESIPDGAYDEAKVNDPRQFTWYIPRNPATDTDNATYIEVTGYDRMKRVTTYRFYPHTEESGTYNYTLERGHAYTYDATIKGLLTAGNSLEERKHFSVTVESATLNTVPANCYVIANGQLTSLPLVRVQEYNDWLVANHTAGNGYAKVLEEDEEWTTEILWSDVEGLIDIKVGAGQGIDNQYILVKPKNDQVAGNALLLLKDSHDRVVWSWHLWVLPRGLSVQSYTPNNRVDNETSAENGINSEVEAVGFTYDVLTLNLGATVEGTGINSRGLFYQWGRKDPFPRTGSTSAENATALASGSFKENGDFYYFNCVVPGMAEREHSALLSSRNPDTFYATNWMGSAYGGSAYGTVNDNRSWEGDPALDKSLFDPCPPGYRVPGEAFFGTELSNKMNRGDCNPAWSTGWNWLTVYRSGDGVPAGFNGPGIFPAAGHRNGDRGAVLDASTSGSYWSGSINATQGCSLYITPDRVSTRSSVARSFGLSVRCVALRN